MNDICKLNNLYLSAIPAFFEITGIRGFVV